MQSKQQNLQVVRAAGENIVNRDNTSSDDRRNIACDLGQLQQRFIKVRTDIRYYIY